MRYLKFVGAVCLVAVLAAVWRLHPAVISAYAEEPDPINFQLGGGDYAFERSPLEPSPFVIDVEAPDLRAAALPAVASAPDATPAVQLHGGSAGLAGTVVGPDGPVAGAIVQIERHTATGSAQTQVLTNEDGTWKASDLLGGRFRVRAYLPNVLADLEPQIFFLRAEEQRPISTRLSGPAERLVVTFHSSGPHYLALASTDAVTVGREVVDAEGRLVLEPVPGHGVSLTLSGAATFSGSPPAQTDGSGALRFAVVCPVLGASSLRAVVQPLVHAATPERLGPGAPAGEAFGAAEAFSFELPDCTEVPPPTTLPGEPPATDTNETTQRTATTVVGAD